MLKVVGKMELGLYCLRWSIYGFIGPVCMLYNCLCGLLLRDWFFQMELAENFFSSDRLYLEMLRGFLSGECSYL